MIRQQAFIGCEKMLKGGLHCHTTRSDGQLCPEEVLRIHAQNGYDFLAITDHRNYNFTNFAPETGITLIPGMEFDGDLPCDIGFRCFHTVCIGPEKADGNGYNQNDCFESAQVKDQFEYQPFLDEIHAKKNLTIHCHPQWSGTSAKYFEQLKGNFAMEVWNSGCALNIDMDNDAAYWDELLGQGIKIYGVATDDGHSAADHCNGWVMVRAENSVNSILKALEEGKFYSSCGPEIYDFYVEGDRAVIECSPASKIRLQAAAHPTVMQKSADGNLTRAEFSLNHWAGKYHYVRMTVIDANGKYAWTNPIYLD